MSSRTDGDPLEQLIERTRRWAKEHSLHALEGFVEETGNLPVVLYNEEGESSLEGFLTVAHAFGAEVIFLNITRLSREDWQKSVVSYEDAEDLSERTESRLRAAQKLEKLIGSVAAVELRVVTKKPQLLMKYDRFSEWFGVIYASSKDTLDEEFEDEEDPKTRALIEELGRVVASDRRYQNARNDIQRRSAVGKILKADPRHRKVELWQILDSAKEIYEAEYRASHEEWLVEEANRLKREGLKRAEIAVRLGISINRVRDLLS
jgi:hypothetical protein